MGESCKILYKEGTGEIVEKKSRFIANIYPIDSEEQALEYIAAIRKKHYDARHNCFAYVLGEKNELERCSDDGEPSGTAGRPMLDILEGQGIHNAVAIVTRYFGGTLLGSGGLVRAYSGAMKEGLAHCVVMEQLTGMELEITTDYNDMGKIQYLARTYGWHERDVQYADTVRMTLLIPVDEKAKAEQEITEKTAGKDGLIWSDEVRYGLADGEVVML